MGVKENLESGLKTAVRTVKSIFKNPVKRWAVIAIAAFASIVIVLGSAYDSLTDAFSKGVSEHIQNNPIQYVNNTNELVISDETIDGLIKVIEDMDISMQNLKLTREDVAKFYAAEAVSSEINRSLQSSETDPNGITLPETADKYYGRVFVKRANPSTGNLERLIFEPSLAKFEAMDASQILNYFSMDGDKICFASITEFTDADGKVTKTVNINKQSYKDNIVQYSMPTEFLLNLCLISQNPGFVRALADKVLQETEIVIQILQNERTTTTTTTYNYSIETEHSTRIESYSSTGMELSSYETTDPPVVNPQKPVVTTKKQRIVSSKLQIHSVKNWIMEIQCDYNKVNATEPPFTGEIVKYDDEEKPRHQYKLYDTKYYLSGYDEIYKSTVSRRVEQTTQDTATTDTITYQEGNNTGVQYDKKVEEFVTMLKTRYEVPGSFIKEAPQGKLESGAGLLFQMLENGDRTQSYAQLMRYLLALATGDNYGVSEFDFSIFNIRNFTALSYTGGPLVNYIRSWEDASLWHYETGKVTIARNVVIQNEEEYCVVYEDGSNGHNNVGYGVATFITNADNVRDRHPLYGGGYYNWENYFSDYGYDVRTFKTGDLVKYDDMIEIFNKIVQNFADIVDRDLQRNGVTVQKNERDALIAVAYQRGNIGNFCEVYQQYGNSDQLKTAFVVNDMNPFNDSLDSRKKANWELFHEGIYRASDGTEIKAGIVDVAEKIHEYMEQNYYTYCVYGGNTCEECAGYVRGSEKGTPYCGLNNTFEESKTGFKHTCCSTYVSWVLQEAGYLDRCYHGATDAYENSVQSQLKKRGWTIITDLNELQPGDVLCYSEHVEIFAGDYENGRAYVYNAGSGPAIRRSPWADKKGIFGAYALRAPY